MKRQDCFRENFGLLQTLENNLRLKDPGFGCVLQNRR
jgi:hypothetical protein